MWLSNDWKGEHTHIHTHNVDSFFSISLFVWFIHFILLVFLLSKKVFLTSLGGWFFFYFWLISKLDKRPAKSFSGKNEEEKEEISKYINFAIGLCNVYPDGNFFFFHFKDFFLLIHFFQTHRHRHIIRTCLFNSVLKNVIVILIRIDTFFTFDFIFTFTHTRKLVQCECLLL